MNINDVFQVRDTFNLTGGQTAVLTRYYRCTTANAADTAEDVNDRVAIDITGSMLAVMDESYHWAARQTINGMDNLDFFEEIGNEPGTRTGSQLPTALCTGIRSFDRGPGFTRSDHLLPCGNVSDLNSNLGVWSGTYIATLGTLLDNFGDTMTLINASVIEPVQLAGGFVLGTAPTVKQSLVGSWQVNNFPTWLRTRQDYLWS